MTVTSTQTNITYPGTGSQTAFTYPFQIPFQPDGVSPAVAIWHVDSTGAYTQLAPSQYSISGVGTDTGGVVTYPLSGSPIGVNDHLIIARATNQLQTTSVDNQGFFPQTLEQVADYITFMVQENGASLSTTIRGVVGDALVQLPPPSQRAGKVLAFDSNGQPYVANMNPGGVGTIDWVNITNVPLTFAPSAHVHAIASSINDGFMSASDKNKLDAIVGTGGVGSVNGKTGAVTLVSTDVGAIPIASKGVANGVPSLDGTGKIPSAQLPATHNTTTYTAASQAAMLALAGVLQGDLCIRSDTSATYILSVVPASVLANWILLPTTAPVTSVNGLTGAVSIRGASTIGIKSIKTDYGAVCDGTTNDTAAWNSAIADINAGSICALIVPGPSGVVGALNPIILTAHCGFSLIGSGPESGLVHLSGGDVLMLSITTPYNAARSTISNLSLRTKQLNLGQALYLAYTPDYNYSGEMNFAMNDVMVTGYNAPQAQLDGWNRGIETLNLRSSTFNNVNFFGYVSAAAYPFNVLNSAWAWYVHATPGKWTINCRWTNCDVSWATTAWRHRNHNEGMSWITCCPAFVGHAWDIQLTDSPGAFPYFEWVNCQSEFFYTGYNIDNASYIEIVACEIFCNNALNTARQAINISNSVSAYVHHNEFICGDSLGTTDMIIYNNVHEGKTEGNNLRGFAGLGIKFTGDSYQCESLNDRVVSPYAAGVIYTNDSSNANQNRRRGMNIINPGAGPGNQDASATNGAFLGNNVVQVNSGTSAQISLPFRVTIGDRLQVTLRSYIQRNAADARVSHTFREYTHRPSAPSPFTVITTGGDVANASVGWNNWAKTSVIQGVGDQDLINATAIFDVVATAADAVFNIDVNTNAGQNAFIGNMYARIERV